jgi:hypothetical protein
MTENYFDNDFVPSPLTGGLLPVMGGCAEPVDPVPLLKVLHCTVRIKMFAWPAGGGGGQFTMSLRAMAPPICTDVNMKVIAAMQIALMRRFVATPFLVIQRVRRFYRISHIP